MGCGSFGVGCRRILLWFVWGFFLKWVVEVLTEVVGEFCYGLCGHFGVGCGNILAWVVWEFWCTMWGIFGVGCGRILTSVLV